MPIWGRIAAFAIITAFLAYLIVPLVASLGYSFWVPGKGFVADALFDAVQTPGVIAGLGLSLGLSVASVAILLVLLVPTIVFVHVAAPRLRGLVEVICTLPLVIPAVSLVAGVMALLRAGSLAGRGSLPQQVSQWLQDPSFPLVLLGCYIVVLLPFAFRVLDNAIASIPAKQLLDSARGLGASFPIAVMRVIVPNLGSALWFCVFFGLSAGLAEYTFSVTMGFHTLSVELMTISKDNFRVSIAVALLVTLFSWVLMGLVLQSAQRIGKVRSRKTFTTERPSA
jgi:putative spermidine/putrescine transport system permease protein